MSKSVWTPWHKVVALRDDLRTGELSLAVFAADLYDVVMQRGLRPVYEQPAQFFALTYPTYNLRELAKDVVSRLAGKNDKAIRQLELTYGGGKTHTLITLFHLVNDPAHLPDLPAAHEFVQHIGMTPPQARVAALCFDKLDVEKGMEVRGPGGTVRWLKQPWSVMAYQLAGDAGLRLLNAEGVADERESAPAENLLVELLSLPAKDGLATLILLDEVLMYAREKVGLDPAWRGRLINFFQYLTQAATKVDRCAIVASLLATDPGKSDTLGKELTQEMHNIFRRAREESVQPVGKDDVAEVLRRRFFTPGSIRDREAFRSHVVAALKGIGDLDEQTRKEGTNAEERYLRSFPFHPDLTEILYVKWTNLEGFQRTRGVLRTFALALREAEQWDTAPLIGTNVFLSTPGEESLSEAARELTNVAATEEYAGKKQEWTSILEGELRKAREIQADTTGLRAREVEQAVVATFLHSQPIGQKAQTRDLLLLIGHTRPDRIDLEKALLRWAQVSWFLDEEGLSDAEIGPTGQKGLPKTWRLGTKPNLRQMHDDACKRVAGSDIDVRLDDEIGRLKSLTQGASAAGAKVHNMPAKPADIEDDGEFHYAVLGPRAVSDSGKPSTEAVRFLTETTAADKPRTYRNALVLVTSSRDGLDVARQRVREYLGWEEVRSQLKGQDVDPVRMETLTANLEAAKKRIPEAIIQAYCIVVTVSEKNDAQAFKIAVTNEPLFTRVKYDQRSRVQDTAVSADALLPEGPYNLWHADETSRRVKDLVGAFAQFPHLPKMLNRKAILDTLLDGCANGMFVIRLRRPDGSFRTFWRAQVDEVALKDPGLEVVLPEAAELTDLTASLLLPNTLPVLWIGETLTFHALLSYFSGQHVVKVQKTGYEEPLAIPKVGRSLLEEAVQALVREGKLWLVNGPASILAEPIPAGLLNDKAHLQAPPPPIPPMEILQPNLLEAWGTEETTALAIATALSNRLGKTMPWARVRDALTGAFNAHLLERTPDSGAWPCDYGGAQSIRVRLPTANPYNEVQPPIKQIKQTRPGVRAAEAELQTHEIQDLAEQIADLRSAASGYGLRVHVRIEVGGDTPPPDDIVTKVNEVLGQIKDDLQLS
jgi:hypothetical protein